MAYKEIVICPVCGHRVQRRVDGTVGSHQQSLNYLRFKCSGTGQPAGKIVSSYHTW